MQIEGKVKQTILCTYQGKQYFFQEWLIQINEQINLADV